MRRLESDVPVTTVIALHFCMNEPTRVLLTLTLLSCQVRRKWRGLPACMTKCLGVEKAQH